MSLIQDVIRLIGELGCADAHDLAPLMPHANHGQIKQALQNAKWVGKLRIAVPSRGQGPTGGKTCAKYSLGAPKPRAVKPVRPLPVNSVWQMGERAMQ